MYGDDAPIDKLWKALQSVVSDVLELSAKQYKLEAELRAIREMLEDRQQH